MGGLVGVLVVSVIILSRTDWGSRQIGGTVAGWFSGNATSPVAAEPASAPAPASETTAPASEPAQAPAAGKPQRDIPPLPTRRPQTPGRSQSAGGGRFQVLVALDRKTGKSPAGQLVFNSRVL